MYAGPFPLLGGGGRLPPSCAAFTISATLMLNRIVVSATRSRRFGAVESFFVRLLSALSNSATISNLVSAFSLPLVQSL